MLYYISYVVVKDGKYIFKNQIIEKDTPISTVKDIAEIEAEITKRLFVTKVMVLGWNIIKD